MSDTKRKNVWLVKAYHFQMGNFELHVERAGVDHSANQWGWDIWRSQPFDQIISSHDVESEDSSPYLTLVQAKRQGIEHLKKAVAGELVDCACCSGRGRVPKKAKHAHVENP